MLAIIQALLLALRIQSDVVFQKVRQQFAIIFASLYVGLTILITLQATLNWVGTTWARITIFALGWLVNGVVVYLAINPTTLLYWGLGSAVTSVLDGKDISNGIGKAFSLLITKVMASIALVVGLFTMYLAVFPFGEQAFIAIPLAFTLSLFGYWAMWSGKGKMFEAVTMKMLIVLVIVLVLPLLAGLTFEWTGKDLTWGREGRAAVEALKALFRNTDRDAAAKLEEIRQKIESRQALKPEELDALKASLDRKESREVLSRGKSLVLGRDLQVTITQKDFEKGWFLISGLEPMTNYTFSAENRKIRIWVKGSTEWFEASLRDGRQSEKGTPYDNRYTWALYADGVRSGEKVRSDSKGEVKVEFNANAPFRNLFRIDTQNIAVNFH